MESGIKMLKEFVSTTTRIASKVSSQSGIKKFISGLLLQDLRPTGTAL